MKILILENNIKWKSLDKRVPKLEKSFNDKLSFMEFTIDRKSIKDTIKIDSWNNHLDNVYMRKWGLKHKKYDAVGMVISRKDWTKAKGRSDLGGFYIVNSDKQHQFYIICEEKSTTKRRGKRLREFEEYLEHELLGHGLNKELGYIEVNDSGKFVAGKDNTHYFFYDTSKEKYYKYMEKEYSILKKNLNSKIQQLKDKIAQAGKKEPVRSKLPKGQQPLLERQAERLILSSKLVYGYDLRVTSSYRSFKEQDFLYAKGRTTIGRIITNAKGGQSLHNYGVAFDLVDRNKGYDIEWKKVWLLWNYITEGKGEWGGNWTNFRDAPHFQNTLGYTLKDFQEGKVDYKKFR